MARPQNVLPLDSEFCERAARAAFVNPFGEEFPTLYSALETECAARVDQLATEGLADLRRFTGTVRETLRLVLLYDAFERFREAFDRIIGDQIRGGDVPVPVPFARELLGLLHRRGFTNDDAVRLVAVFFQIRRAHYFIAEGLIGSSACMREFRRHLWENIFTHDIRCYERWLWDRMEDFSTLLLGETGTGKGTAAAAIGRSAFIPFDEKKQEFAESFTRGFQSINLSQFPESLIESELFGHRKGAFTGAVEAHEGIFARCSPYGAIFLDEVGEVSAPVQIKLLKVLQDRVFSPVGSHDTVRFRGRVIAATNRSLENLRGDSGFRDDFYYRLCSDTITVPPLGQRLREDPTELKALVKHIVERIAGEGASELLALVEGALIELVRKEYRWPGNVRELEQAVRQILIKRSYEPSRSGAQAGRAERLASAVADGVLDADSLLGQYCALLYERSGNLEEVARRTNLDRRTVKRYLATAAKS